MDDDGCIIEIHLRFIEHNEGSKARSTQTLLDNSLEAASAISMPSKSMNIEGGLYLLHHLAAFLRKSHAPNRSN